MFKSLFSLVERVVSIFTTKQSNTSEKQETEQSDTDESTHHNREAALNAEETGPSSFEVNGLALEVDEVDVFDEDWGGRIPQRASALFPQTIPSRKEDFEPITGPVHIGIGRGTPNLSEVRGRQTPSATQLFTEAEADLKPTTQPDRPQRPYPQYKPVPEEPVVQPVPPERQYSAYVQVGRLMKQDPAPPPPPPSYHDHPPVIHRPPRRARQRLIQPIGAGRDHDALEPMEQGAYRDRRNAPLPPPPRGIAVSGEESAPMAYHDIHGERGAISRSQVMSPYDDFDHQVSPELELSTPNLNGPINNGGLLGALRPTTAPPTLKPKPVRFTKGNYLRFWGNYSAQPSYLHFGSLIRSERFIDLLPVWHNDLDELEEEAREEWSYLDSETPFEGEADWRRLLNPTMSSPIDFLLHRDRVEQLSLLPRGRSM